MSSCSCWCSYSLFGLLLALEKDLVHTETHLVERRLPERDVLRLSEALLFQCLDDLRVSERVVVRALEGDRVERRKPGQLREIGLVVGVCALPIEVPARNADEALFFRIVAG